MRCLCPPHSAIPSCSLRVRKSSDVHYPNRRKIPVFPASFVPQVRLLEEDKKQVAAAREREIDHSSGLSLVPLISCMLVCVPPKTKQRLALPPPAPRALPAPSLDAGRHVRTAWWQR